MNIYVALGATAVLSFLISFLSRLYKSLKLQAIKTEQFMAQNFLGLTQKETAQFTT